MKALVVDYSAVMRKILTRALGCVRCEDTGDIERDFTMNALAGFHCGLKI